MMIMMMSINNIMKKIDRYNDNSTNNDTHDYDKKNKTLK